MAEYTKRSISFSPADEMAIQQIIEHLNATLHMGDVTVTQAIRWALNLAMKEIEA